MTGEPGSRLLELVEVMDRLRRECPWDRQQTHRSLARYLLEECYETLEALESGDTAHLQEELGDLLLQVFFHARIAAEEPDGFTIEEVAGGIVDKLVYRHPHVFAGVEVADADEVNRNWETLKAAEKQRSSPLEGIPVALPALAYADKVVGRLTRSGADVTGHLDDRGGEAVGDRLLALVVEARADGLDAEQELRDAVRRLIDRE
jgi:XTP/dITP diphosphohydrolase